MKLKLTFFLIAISVLCFSQNRISSTQATSLINEIKMASATKKINVAIQLETAQADVFAIEEVKTQLPENLMKKYPGIRAFRGISKSNPNETCFVTINQSSIFGVVSREKGFVEFKNKSTHQNQLEVIVEDADAPIQCKHLDNDLNRIPKNNANNGSDSASTLKATPEVLGDTYRIIKFVMSLSYYQNQQLGITTKAQGLTWLNTRLAIMNERYGKEIAVNFALVPTTDDFIYLDASDPYPDASVGDALVLMDIFKNDLATNLGTANYHNAMLFHPLSVGRGGDLYCLSNGTAITSSSVGLSLHELGHSLGAYDHSYMYESSSTIQNLHNGFVGHQGDQTKYFHAVSWKSVANYLINYSTCLESGATGNTPPTITSVSPATSVTIPISTPFVLSGTATDPDASAALVGGWDQIGLSESSADQYLMWAYKEPSATGNVRYFPDLTYLLSNTTDPYFKYPTTNGYIQARFIIRDGQLPYGGATYKDVSFNTDNTAGPFVVTYPNTNLSFTGAQAITVTWNVANTTNASVNTQNVNILISTDGGYNWSTLLTNTANDGTESVTLPDVSSTACRIKVEPVGNIYFDVSDVNFSITSSAASDFNLTAITNYNTVYNETSSSFIYNFTKVGAFSNNVNVTYTGIPAGASIPSPLQLTASGDFNVVVNGLNSVTPGKYTITITLTEDGGSLTKFSTFTLIKKAVGDPTSGTSIKVSAENNAPIVKFFKPMVTNTFTMMEWIKPSAASRGTSYDANGLLTLGDFNDFNTAYPTMTNMNGIQFNPKNNTFTIYLKESGKTLTDVPVPMNVWSHVALVVTPTKAMLYLDGNLVYTKVTPINAVNLGNHMGIGKSDWYRTVYGEYDEVKIFDKSLSETELQEEMHRNIDYTNNHLLHYYQFNEASGNPISKVSFDETKLNSATRVNSVIPAGTADVFTANKPLSLTALGTTSLNAVYNASGPVTGVVTAHKINVAPNTLSGIPFTQSNMNPNAYWEINSYPSNPSNENIDVQFKVSGDVLPADLPSNYTLYYRNQTGTGDWQYGGLAESINPTDDTVLFKSVTSRSQFVVYSSTDPAIDLVGIDNISGCFQSPDGNKVYSYSVKGISLTDVITVTSSNADVLISTSPTTGYAATLTLTPSSGSVNQMIYAKYVSTTIADASTTITATSPNTISKSSILNIKYRKTDDRGNALRLHGGSERIKLSFPSVPDDFTVEFWYKPIGALSSGSHRISSGSSVFSVTAGSDGSLTASVDGFWSIYAPAGSYVVNKWTHVAVTYNKSLKTLSLYVNGKLVAYKATYVNSPTNWTTFLIGATSGSANGEIDEFRIWSSTRTAQQIQENMHVIYDLSTACTDGLMAYYQFEDALTNGLKDVTGNYSRAYNTTDFVGSPSLEISSAPFGRGKAQTMDVTAAGDYNFSNVDLSANFSGVIPNGKVVVSKIQGAPFAAPTTTGAITNNYWIIDNYGTNAGLTANLTFTATDFVTSANVGDYGFFKRESNGYEAWNPKVTSNALNGSLVTFNGVDSFSQFILERIIETLSTDTVNKDKIIVYPNPVKKGDLLNFIGVKDNSVITIYDSTGKLVFRDVLTSQKLYLPYYISSGTYLLNITHKGTTISNLKLMVK